MAWNEVFWTGSSSGVATAAVVWLLSVLWVFREVLAHRSERVRETSLRGRVVWITGASSGIGRALAFRLAVRYGARVIVSARRVERLESLAVQVQEALQAQDKGPKRAQHTTLPSVLIEPMDLLGNMAAIEETVRRVRRHRASIVILNAGVNQGGQLFTNTSMETLRQVLQINLWAPVQIIRLLLEQSPSHLAHAEDGIVADKSMESVIEPKPCRGQRSASAKRRWRVHDLGTHLRILAAMRDMFGFRPDTTESRSEASFASSAPSRRSSKSQGGYSASTPFCTGLVIGLVSSATRWVALRCDQSRTELSRRVVTDRARYQW
ncbi:hypothetical protein F1559_004147 [Cyanidiococcus yangmingshanensis]|uniref:Dehydrogenase reductase SDR member 7B n=1 Tax=Cyanidiococcus yangmingshanensis TaxID=2690220 RepID=A0A7J7IP52_9RHOD|nr:hypothetical protein F1559_004147 [Cyanidiococcus yangmingshanensis]